MSTTAFIFTNYETAPFFPLKMLSRQSWILQKRKYPAKLAASYGKIFFSTFVI